MQLVTSARICEVNGRGREAYERPTARETKQTARWSRRNCVNQPAQSFNCIGARNSFLFKNHPVVLPSRQILVVLLHLAAQQQAHLVLFQRLVVGPFLPPRLHGKITLPQCHHRFAGVGVLNHQITGVATGPMPTISVISAKWSATVSLFAQALRVLVMT